MPAGGAISLAVEAEAYRVRGARGGAAAREVLKGLFLVLGFLVGPLVHQGGRYDFRVRGEASVLLACVLGVLVTGGVQDRA